MFNNLLTPKEYEVYPVCTFLMEMSVQLRFDPCQHIKGYSIIEMEGGVLHVSTRVSNLMPLDSAVSPHYQFYRCWLNQVERDGRVTLSLPMGIFGVNGQGNGETFGQIALSHIPQYGCGVDQLNVITVTAESREGGPGPDGKLVLAGRISKRIVRNP